MGRHNILPGERCTVVVGMDTEPTVHMEFFQPGGGPPVLKKRLPTGLPIRCSRRAGADGMCWQHRRLAAKKTAALVEV